MKKSFLSVLLVMLMVLSVVTVLPLTVFATGTTYAITNGTAQDAHGSISFNKATVAEGETVTITVNPATGYKLKSLAAVPEAPTISTIADVLATVEGFPEDIAGETHPVTPSGAWGNGNGGFAFIYGRGNAFILYKDGYTYGFLTTPVTKTENCYTATISYGSLTFNMENDVLTSFEFTADSSKPNAANYVGIYAPESTPSPSLKSITLEKQQDGTYQFTMPAYAVTVTAEFEAATPTPTHTHTGVLQNGQPANETAAGFNAYYKCDCGLCFEDEDCTVEIGDDTALTAWKSKGGNGYVAPNGYNNPENDDESINLWWLLVLIAVVVVGGVGTAYCFVGKKKKNK